jgi:hypothetical protein
VQDTEGTHLYDTTWDPVIPEFEGAITPLLETADWGEDTLMVCEDALRVLHKGFAFSSPLQDLLAGQSIHTAVAAGSGDTASLWLGTDVALYRWEGDNLAQVQPTGLPTANALLAEGGSYDGNPALWLAAEGWLVAILPASEGLQSVPVLNNLAVTDLSVDSGQWLWLVSEGDIVRRHPEGEWEWLAFPEPVQAVHGRADSPTTWFVLETSLVVHEDGAYRLVEGVTPPTDADITEAGDLLIADATGVARVMLDAVAPEVIAWNSHIAPIYEKECALCHSPDNIAEDFSAMQTWIDSIALIMTRVQTDMPANDPPLDPASVSLIQQWIDGGFSP